MDGSRGYDGKYADVGSLPIHSSLRDCRNQMAMFSNQRSKQLAEFIFTMSEMYFNTRVPHCLTAASVINYVLIPMLLLTYVEAKSGHFGHKRSQ